MSKSTILALAITAVVGLNSCTKSTSNAPQDTNAGAGSGSGTSGKYPVITSRDKLVWPFASNSIWNTSIGSNAKYVDLGATLHNISADVDWFIVCKESDPAVPTYNTQTFFQGRCGGTDPQPQGQYHPELLQNMKIPQSLIIADAVTSGGIYSTPNSSSAFLAPDGRTLDQLNVTTRCSAGGPLYGYRITQHDIYGDGIEGAHLGSALSSIGGSMRTGELTGNAAIRHVLKIDIWGNYMYYDKKTGSGHRWPAELNDQGAPNSYKGGNSALVMGSLLAIPPSVNMASLNLKTNAAKLIFTALQDFGAYVCDDSGLDGVNLCIENNANEEYKAKLGRYIDQDTDLNFDLNLIWPYVKVVDNNTADNIGGGGTLRVPLPPPITN